LVSPTSGTPGKSRWRRGGKVLASTFLESPKPLGKEIAMSDRDESESLSLQDGEDPRDTPQPAITPSNPPPVVSEPPPKGDDDLM
jgi:hypothetical protein